MRSTGPDEETHVTSTFLSRGLLTRGLAIAVTSGLAVTLSACSSGGSSDSSASSSSSSAPANESSAPAASTAPFGVGCAGVPAEGAGSFAGMATVPVVTAASANPALSTLARAVTQANLVDSLNTAPDLTLLAPANPAFDAVPPDILQPLMADTAQLTSVLLHHVIQGRLTPDQLAGTHTTLNNDQITIEGSGENFAIAGEGTLSGSPATVICGNVPTANATVYVIDGVLKPAS
jgi:uncharacterized surface protein with fasciclin (FAS1) repeats